MVRPGQRDGRSDGLAKCSHRAITGQHQMIAIVDGHAQRRVMVRPAAPPGPRRTFRERHRHTGARQVHRRRQPGKPGARHCYPRKAHVTYANRLKRSAASASRHFDERTRTRGACQPLRSICASIRE